MPAVLHAGDFVMRQEAVQRIGRQPLEAMNRGAPAGEYTIIVEQHFPNVHDSRGFEEALKKNEVAFIRFIRWLEREGAW